MRLQKKETIIMFHLVLGQADAILRVFCPFFIKNKLIFKGPQTTENRVHFTEETNCIPRRKVISNVLYFETQETWQRAETRRIWQFLYVYPTTASGMQQRASTLKQAKGVRHSMSLKKHFRNSALSEVTNFLLKSSPIYWKIHFVIMRARWTLILDFVVYTVVFYRFNSTYECNAAIYK